VSAPTASQLYTSARKMAEKGQPVFPVRSVYENEKRKAKVPLCRWRDEATTDADQIKAWWRKNRDASIGIPTGIVWDVLDVDTKRDEDGRVHLPTLTELGLLNGCKFVVKTPSGGWHLYFLTAPGLTNKANPTLGLDVRSLGGYVLAPGSYIDATADPDAGYAGHYEFEGETTGSTDDPLWWDLIVQSITPMNATTKEPVVLLDYERRASIASLRGWLSERKHGERNNSLHWAVCRCIENGIDPHELVEVATTMLDLPEEEVLLTIGSALRRAGVVADDLESEAEALFKD
jgi:hypothetical protein